MKIEAKAAKTHSCEKCGCNIYKGQIHYSERVYIPVSYEPEWEIKTGGYTTTLRGHIHSAQCIIAIKEVQNYFLNIPLLDKN